VKMTRQEDQKHILNFVWPYYIKSSNLVTYQSKSNHFYYLQHLFDLEAWINKGLKVDDIYFMYNLPIYKKKTSHQNIICLFYKYRTVKNFGGEKTLTNLANHNNSPTFFRQFSCFAIWGVHRNVSCALIVSCKDRGKDIDIAAF